MVKIVSQKYFNILSVEKIIFFNLFLKTEKEIDVSKLG